ncbi:MAG: hypothetical protein EB036_14765, partial [Betaproteobacteria bacterium]|nr:hypothetical protein [Betaproteobacteria bacterium]
AAQWKSAANVVTVDVDVQAKGFAQQLWAGQPATQKARYGNNIDIYTRIEYHGTLASPLCFAAVKGLFDQFK